MALSTDPLVRIILWKSMITHPIKCVDHRYTETERMQSMFGLGMSVQSAVMILILTIVLIVVAVATNKLPSARGEGPSAAPPAPSERVHAGSAQRLQLSHKTRSVHDDDTLNSYVESRSKVQMPNTDVEIQPFTQANNHDAFSTQQSVCVSRRPCANSTAQPRVNMWKSPACGLFV